MLDSNTYPPVYDDYDEDEYEENECAQEESSAQPEPEKKSSDWMDDPIMRMILLGA